MMRKRIRDLEEDIEDVGERLIKIIPTKPVQDDPETEETILPDQINDNTQLEETKLIIPKMVSTVQKVSINSYSLFFNFSLEY